MSKYHIHFNTRLDEMTCRHVEFIARVSIKAAKQFRKELGEVIETLEQNPFLYQFLEDPNLPPGMYRKTTFAKWYKLIYFVDGNTVYLDAIVDSRTGQ